MRRGLMAAAIGLVAVAIGLVARERARPTVVVDAGPITQRVVAQASVGPAGGVARIRAVEPGTIDEVRPRPGDRVDAGAVIVRLRASSPDAAARSITAPIAGQVLSRAIDPGDTVAAGELLVEIGDVDHLELRIEIEEPNAAQITLGQPIVVRPRGGGATLAEATIERLGPALERRRIGATDARLRAEARVRPAWAKLPGGRGFLVGQELEAVLALPPHDARARVPHRALRIEDGRAMVDLPGWITARAVEVELGPSDDRFVEVKGVEPGARVTTY